MGNARFRYSAFGFILLVLVSGSLLAWLRLSHAIVMAIAFSLLVLAGSAAMGWNGWRQTTRDNLAARGLYADDRNLPVYDPGLRREIGPLIPSSISRRMSGSEGRRRPAPSVVRSQPSMATPIASAKSPRNSSKRQRIQPLSPDATVNFATERREADIDDVFAALDTELVGLVGVKEKVAEIGSLLMVDRARQRFGLSASRPNLHMCFTGAPGTGKTTVALRMADLLHRLGYLESGHLVHAMRDDLVAEYIGQTAPRTKHVLARAMGGVLFIDEAYSLFRGNDSKDYGQECVDILMQVMENERERLVVILAGYKDRMDVFFESNPGMRSRVAHHLDFGAYEADELLAIGQLMLDRSSYYLSQDAMAALREYLSAQRTHAHFANARSVRNLLETARLRHARRLAAEPDRFWTKDDLMRLEPSDILASRDAG